MQKHLLLPMKERKSEAALFTPSYAQTTVRELYERKFKLIKIISGTAEFTTQGKTLKAGNGEYIFVTPGCFSRIRMIPSPHKPFQMICLNISDKFLTNYRKQHPGGIRTEGPRVSTFQKLQADPWLETLYASLQVYTAPDTVPDEELTGMKLNECMYILKKRFRLNLFSSVTDKTRPTLSLEELINRNYMFNAPMQRFAELAGKSLSTFRRECIRLWGMPPARVLMEKRLEAACRMLIHEGRRPSEIYDELGFETLAHFSRCFKQKYGVPPTRLAEIRPGLLPPSEEKTLPQ